MRLISLEAISRHYTPIILWQQEVDEQVQTDSGVKAGGFLMMMEKFNTYFYVKVLRMVFSIVECVSAQLQNAQLNFCKARYVIASTKVSITTARNDTRFDGVWSGIVSATEANNVVDDPKLSRSRKVSRRFDESSNALFHAEAKDNYRQLYYEVLDYVISGLSDRFEPDAIAVHLTNIENFLFGKRKDSVYIARTYKDDINAPRLTLHRDLLINRAMSAGQPLKSFNDVVELLKREQVFRELVPELTNLVKIMLSLPASTCTAERRFSGLRC